MPRGASMPCLVVALVLGCISPGALVDQLGAREAAEMLAAHNQVRRRVGVPDLKWSRGLAEQAERWAATLARRGCVLRTSPAEPLGENLFRLSRETTAGSRDRGLASPTTVVDFWAAEARDYSYTANRCAGGKACGHYTQIVWRETREVGCGAALCPGDGQIWVCNYSPPGNVRGKRPY